MNGCKKVLGSGGHRCRKCVEYVCCALRIRYAHGEGKQTAVKMEKSVCGGWLIVVGHHKQIIVWETLYLYGLCLKTIQLEILLPPVSTLDQKKVWYLWYNWISHPAARKLIKPNIEKTDLESAAKLSLVGLNIHVFLFLWVLLHYHSLAVFTSCLMCLPTAGFFLYLHSKLQQLLLCAVIHMAAPNLLKEA